MAEKCAALLFNCPECERKFKGSERVEICPDCGADLHCEKWAVPGYKFCERHGGPAPSRNFYGKGRGIVTGEGSQFPITRLASKYVEMNKDGRILSNRASIAVVRQRVQELLERLGNNQFPDQMETLQKLWREYRGKENTVEGIKVKLQLDQAFEAAYHDYAGWTQVFQALELDSKMVEREAKVAKDLHAILTAEDAYKLVANVPADPLPTVISPSTKPVTSSENVNVAVNGAQ